MPDLTYRRLEPLAGEVGPACAVSDDPVSGAAAIGQAYYDRAKVSSAQGDVIGAIAANETAVMYVPAFAEAHSNLGNLYLQSGRRDEALRAYETAIRAKPDLAPVYCNVAAVLIELDRCAEAISALETALRLAPDLHEAHVNLCRAYRRSGRDREALAPALRATELRPDRDTFLNVGEAAFHLEAYDIALEAYQRALALDSACAKTHCNLGAVYQATGRHAEAIAAGEAALALQPDFVAAHCNLGAAYQPAGRYAEAITAAQAAIVRQPNFALAYANLGAVYYLTGLHAEALEALETAVALQPDLALAHCNLGAVYRSAGRYADAIVACETAIALRPHSAVAHDNLGVVYHATRRYAEAIAAGEAATALQPDFATAHFNLACSLLVGGNFARGWDEYIWTWRVPARRAELPYLDRAPLWSGETFTSRRLLISADEGFGDVIQFVRYLPAVKARGGRVILEVKEPLGALFADLPDSDEVRVYSGSADLADAADLQIPLSGIPRALGTDLASIPASIPYLRAKPQRVERWRPRFGSASRLRVGIVRAGNPQHVGDGLRSVRLDDFARLGEIEGVAWFGLQKGRDEDRRSCGLFTVDPLGAEIRDFADTAAIVAQLDLVIAVDTAIVHLAGALGKPVWTLLPFAADWRWLLLRDDSPWYPTMRLFRQPGKGDWASVFADVARAARISRNLFVVTNALAVKVLHRAQTYHSVARREACLSRIVSLRELALRY